MNPTPAQLLEDHTTLSISCIDRIYLNGYIPGLQTSGQLVYFMTSQLGAKIPSPALLQPLREEFVAGVEAFARDHDLPWERFRKGVRKDTLAAKHRREFRGEDGVVFIGVAQEKASSFRAKKCLSPTGYVFFDFSRQSVAVNHYYFYLQDPEWGPAFLKVGSYAPYPVKVCLNGHEWAKQQLRHLGIEFEPLDNGFRSCEEPELLQEICNALGPQDVQSFFDRWVPRLPWPLSPQMRQAGYEHRLSIWQFELSFTQVFERPLQGRRFFEETIRENLDLGRPERVSLLFPTRLTKATPPPRSGYRTRVITSGVQPSLHVEYKSSHVKQYFKEGRALRTETTINNPYDLQINKGLENLPKLREAGEQINQTLLEIERASEGALLAGSELERLQQPTIEEGQRAPALRFGDLRVMALLEALCLWFHVPFGFRNQQLRTRVAALLGVEPSSYTAGKMTYDLRRLRRKGLILRIEGTYRYVLTPEGRRAAYFFTKLHQRILKPGMAHLHCDSASTRSGSGSMARMTRAFRNAEQEIQRMCEETFPQAA